MQFRTTTLVLATSLLAFISCEKENSAPETTALKKGIMVFETREQYEQTLKLSAAEKKALLQKHQNAGTYRSMVSVLQGNRLTGSLQEVLKKLPEELPFIISLLNEDGVLQIGQILYKLDFSERKVFVLQAKDNDLNGNSINYKDLTEGNLANKRIGEFSMDDEVLGYTEAGIFSREMDNLPGEKTQGLFCWRKSGADAKTDKGKFQFLDVNNTDPAYKRNFVDWQIEYGKYGIYFELSAKLKIKKNTSSSSIDDCEGYIDDNATREYSMDFNVRYEGKCKDEYEQFRSGTDYGPLSGENKIVRNFWQSGNGLHKYDLNINFRILTRAIADKLASGPLNSCGHPNQVVYIYFNEPTLYTVYPNFYPTQLRIIDNY